MNVAALEGAICDKPGWWEKIFDAAIIEKWRVEAAPLLAGMTDESPEVFDLRWPSCAGHKGPGTRLFHRSLISPSGEMTMKSHRPFMLFEQKQSRGASSITPSASSYLHGYPDTS